MNQEPLIPKEETQDTASQSEATDTVPASKKLVDSVFDVVEMFAWSVFAVLLLFTFALDKARALRQWKVGS